MADSWIKVKDYLQQIHVPLWSRGKWKTVYFHFYYEAYDY